MTPSIAPSRARLGTLVLLALAVATASPATATIIDSFTDPLPANSRLPVTGASILFLGEQCDAAACPPGTIVTNEFFDCTEQSGLPGVLAALRKICFATYFEPNPGASGVLVLDPASGGSLALETPGGPALTAQLNYGDNDHPMNLDLEADGSDRIEIEILAMPSSPFGDLLQVLVGLGRDRGYPTEKFAGRVYEVSAAGVLVVPYADLPGLEDFDDDVDFLEFGFYGIRPGALVVGEIRTAPAPTPADASSWGRIKSAYRR